MKNFEGISFLWAIFLIALIAAIYGLRAFLGYRAVARDAESDYDYKLKEGMIDKRLSREGYIRAYKRFNNPRDTAYVAGGLASILILTIPAMVALQFIFEQIWKFSGRSRVFEPGFLVWQFFLFFSIIGVWSYIGYLTAKRYHRGTPISWRDEMLREMDEL